MKQFILAVLAVALTTIVTVAMVDEARAEEGQTTRCRPCGYDSYCCTTY